MMPIIRSKLATYVERTRKLIFSPVYLERSRERPEDFTRKRKMHFPNLIMFMVSRKKNSTQNALENFFEKLGEKVFMTQQAFSEARYKVKVSALTTLFYLSVQIAYEGYYETYLGYRILAIDGTKLALPDIELLGKIYGTMGADSSSPTAQGSVCYDILNKVVVDALIEPLTTDERTLAMMHVSNLEKSRRFKKELIIMDRGYPSFELIHALHEAGVTFVMRVKKGFNNDIDAQKETDGRVTLRKKGYPDIEIRVIKVELPTGETEVLISNLFSKGMGIAAFKKLYFLRWPVETKIDEVKNKLEIENFTGYSKKSIEQDFYASMYLANIAAAACWEAQAQANEARRDKNNKYEYKINVNHAIGVLKDRFIYALSLDADICADEIETIINLLAKRVCPVKPNRSFPRKTPRKAKFHSNFKSNA